MLPGFIPALRDKILSSTNCLPEIIDYYEEKYRSMLPEMPGAPPIEELTLEDMPAVVGLNNFAKENGETWESFKRRKRQEDQVETDHINPQMPGWQSKTEDRPSVWGNDSGGEAFSPMGKTKLSNEIRMASPVCNADVSELVGRPPILETEVLDSIVAFCVRISKLFVWSLGDGDNANFRWAPALCLLMGLGKKAFRTFAKCMNHEGDWQFWENCSDKELVDDVLDARKCSGYSIGLLRTDFSKISRIVENENKLEFAPRWYGPMVALQIGKHCRFCWKPNGQSYVFVAYKGVHSYISVSDEMLGQPLSADVNTKAVQELCRTLKLPRQLKKKKGQSTACDREVHRVMTYIHWNALPQLQPLRTLTDIIPGPGVVISTSNEMNNEQRWIDPGIIIQNVARVNLETGVVDKEASVSGIAALGIEWPRSNADNPGIMSWRSRLPAVVVPELPAAVLRRHIKNFNDLDHPEGFDAYFNATILTDLVRPEIAGSNIGIAVTQEYPLIFVMPTGSTEDDTTDQGKTTVALLIGQAMVPGMQIDSCPHSSSAPAMRQAFARVVRQGSTLYDEFVLSLKHDHLLNQRGLQSLATGGCVNPGVAMENPEDGARLTHPLLFTAKIAAFPRDVINRMMPVFLDALTDGTETEPSNMATDDELAVLTSGTIASLMRFSALMWIRKNNFTNKVKELIPHGGKLRFKGHQAVAHMLLGDDRAKLDDYLEAAYAQSIAQRLAADESGLSDSVGNNSRFDPLFYFESAQEHVIEQLAVVFEFNEKAHKATKPLDVLRDLVEDGGRRIFSVELGKYHITEKSAGAAFSLRLRNKDMPFVRGRYQMSYVERDKSRFKDAQGHPVATVVLGETGPAGRA